MLVNKKNVLFSIRTLHNILKNYSTSDYEIKITIENSINYYFLIEVTNTSNHIKSCFHSRNNYQEI